MKLEYAAKQTIHLMRLDKQIPVSQADIFDWKVVCQLQAVEFDPQNPQWLTATLLNDTTYKRTNLTALSELPLNCVGAILHCDIGDRAYYPFTFLSYSVRELFNEEQEPYYVLKIELSTAT